MLYCSARCCTAVQSVTNWPWPMKTCAPDQLLSMKTLITRWVSQMFTTAGGRVLKPQSQKNSVGGRGQPPFYVKTNSVKKFVKFDTATSCDIGTQTWDQLTQLVELKFLRKQIFSWSNSILKFVLSLPGRICSDRPKYFPWLTFNFRLRTGHKSELGYLRLQTWCCNSAAPHAAIQCYNAMCAR